MQIVRIGSHAFNLDRMTDARYTAAHDGRASELRIYWPYLNDSGEPAMDFLEGREADALWGHIIGASVYAWIDRPNCELCDEPAELVGDQWVCRNCSPVLTDEPARTNDAEDRYNRGGW